MLHSGLLAGKADCSYFGLFVMRPFSKPFPGLSFSFLCFKTKKRNKRKFKDGMIAPHPSVPPPPIITLRTSFAGALRDVFPLPGLAF
jgi:hypothetical protein